MKKTLFSALALVTVMTACHSTDVVTPRPATGVHTTATSADDTIQYRVDGHSEGSAVAGQFGTPGAAVQPAGREGSVGNRPVGNAPAAGGPVTAVMPADTLAKLN